MSNLEGIHWKGYCTSCRSFLSERKTKGLKTQGDSFCFIYHCNGTVIASMGFPGGSEDKESVCNLGDPGLILGSGRSPGEGNATQSSILAWRIPGTEEPGALQSTGLQRVKIEWAIFTFTSFFICKMVGIIHITRYLLIFNQIKTTKKLAQCLEDTNHSLDVTIIFIEIDFLSHSVSEKSCNGTQNWCSSLVFFQNIYLSPC